MQREVGEDRVLIMSTTRELSDWLAEHGREGDLVLMKGSGRLDHFERLAHDDRDPIACWTQTCRMPIRCETCPRLRATNAS